MSVYINEDENSEVLKNEFNLDINDFGICEESSGLYGLAKLIQTLFLIIPGTYPNHKDLGIGIQNYVFEILDTQTLAEIREKAQKQCSKYLPSIYISNIYVEKILNKLTGTYNKIGVLVNVLDPKTGNNELILSFEQAEGKGRKVVSNIYVS